MKAYIEQNKKVYDETAREFQLKKDLRASGTANFVDYFLSEFAARAARATDILEVGPGSGYASKLMSEQGYNVTAIEFSEAMADLAHETAPKAKMIVADFLTHDFAGQNYDGILAIAFIHLFTSDDAQIVAKKMFELLRPSGIVFLSTTKHEQTKEGFMRKSNFASEELRFRHQYTRPELEQLLTSVGFVVLAYSDTPDAEVPGKVWMNFKVQRPQ